MLWLLVREELDSKKVLLVAAKCARLWLGLKGVELSERKLGHTLLDLVEERLKNGSRRPLPSKVLQRYWDAGYNAGYDGVSAVLSAYDRWDLSHLANIAVSPTNDDRHEKECADIIRGVFKKPPPLTGKDIGVGGRLRLLARRV